MEIEYNYRCEAHGEFREPEPIRKRVPCPFCGATGVPLKPEEDPMDAWADYIRAMGGWIA